MAVAASLVMDVEIQNRHFELQPVLREMIDARIAELQRRYPELIRLHLTLQRSGHHAQGVDEADMLAVCAGATLRVAKQKEHMRDAVHAAFVALERQLEAHHRRRTRVVSRRADAAS